MTNVLVLFLETWQEHLKVVKRCRSSAKYLLITNILAGFEWKMSEKSLNVHQKRSLTVDGPGRDGNQPILLE